MKKLKYFLLMLVVFTFITPSVYADTSKKRDDTNNYGVNKKWKITNKNKQNVLDTPYVDASLSIYDYADILDADLELILKNKIDIFKKKYNTEIVILTVDKNIDELENETIASDFYDYNDFGINVDGYDGILIYRNANKQTPYYGMYMFGHAQLILSEQRYNYILDTVYYNMLNKEYETSFKAILARIDIYYSSGIPEEMKNAYIDNNGFIKYKYKPSYVLAFIISLATSLVIVKGMVSKNKMVKKATKAEDYLDLKTINYTKRDNIFVNTHTSSYTVSSSSSGGSGSTHSGGGHSSRGSSGGGHSGGGRRG